MSEQVFPLESYAVWQHPLSSARIYMHREAVRTVSSSALRSLKLQPRSEIGGLLWGQTSKDPKDPYTAVTDVEFIESGSRLYNTIPSDTRKLESAISRGSTEPDVSLVGYFRSHVREGLCLSDEDKGLIEKRLRDDTSVFLVVRPFEIGVCIGGFFFWDGDRLQIDGSDLEVPFASGPEVVGAVNGKQQPDDGVKTARQWTAVQPEVEAANDFDNQGSSSETKDNIHHEATSAGRSDAPRRRRLPYLAMISGLGTIAIAGAYLSIPMFRPAVRVLSTPTSQTQVELQVTRAQNGQLNLDWDRNVPQLAAARNAKLTIADGPINRELNLDTAQLRLGRLTYFPTGTDVRFRLELNLGGKRSLSESVRVLLPKANTSSGEPLVSHSTNTQPLGTNILKRPADLRSPPFVRSQEPAQPRKIDRAVLPPSISTDHAKQNTVASSIPGPKLPALPTSRQPVVAKLNPSAVLPNPSGVTLSNSSVYLPARPLQQIKPETRDLPANAISQLTAVKVRVRIDPAGRVVDARVAHHEKSGNLLLEALAVSAAEKWVFAPAMMHGKAVPAFHTIIFAFRPAK